MTAKATVCVVLGADLVVSVALFMDGAAGHARIDVDGVHVDVLLPDEDAVSVFERGRYQLSTASLIFWSRLCVSSSVVT